MLEITEHSQITYDENIRIYDELLNKLKNSIYSLKLDAAISNLDKGREKFLKLELNEQCQVINEMLKLTKCDSTNANLTLIGGPKSAGILTLGKNITKQKNIYIVNQSPTGLFEERKDLTKL